MAKLTQELNIITLSIGSTNLSSGVAQLDTTKYDGTVIYTFEIWITKASGSADVRLRRRGTSTDDATISGVSPGTTPTRYTATFSPPAGATDYIVLNTAGGADNVHSAKILIEQNGTITKTITFREIGAQEGGSDTSFVPQINPKYWNYDSSKYDGSPAFYAEVTYQTSQSMYSVSVELQEDNGSFASWTSKVTILSGGTATSSEGTLVRSAAFAPTNGRNYRIAVKISDAMGTYTIYNAKIVIDQPSSPTKFELERLSIKQSQSGTGIINSSAVRYDPAQIDSSYETTWYHEAYSISASGQSDLKLQSEPFGSPADVTNSTITDCIQLERSAAMTMPASAATIATNITSNPSGIAGSKLIIVVIPSTTTPVSSDAIVIYESRKGVRKDGANVYESKGRITKNGILVWESKQPVVKDQAVIYEALRQIRSDADHIYEAMAGIRKDGQTPYESKQPIATAGAPPYEAGQGIRSDAFIPYESTKQLARDAGAAFEALQGLRADGVAIWESLGIAVTPVSQDAVIPFESKKPITTDAFAIYEALGGIRVDGAAVLESLKKLIADSPSPFESQRELRANGETPYESKHRAAANAIAPYEAGRQIRADAVNVFESVQRILTDAVAIWESLGVAVTPVSQDAVVPFESKQQLTKDGTISYESLQALKFDAAALFESLKSITEQAQANYESKQSIRVDASSPFESKGTTAAQAQIAYEAATGMLVDALLAYEALSTPYADAAVAYESLARISQDAAAVWESLGLAIAISQDALIPFESGRIIQADGSINYEALTGLLNDATIPYEARRLIIIFGQIFKALQRIKSLHLKERKTVFEARRRIL